MVFGRCECLVIFFWVFFKPVCVIDATPPPEGVPPTVDVGVRTLHLPSMKVFGIGGVRVGSTLSVTTSLLPSLEYILSIAKRG